MMLVAFLSILLAPCIDGRRWPTIVPEAPCIDGRRAPRLLVPAAPCIDGRRAPRPPPRNPEEDTWAKAKQGFSVFAKAAVQFIRETWPALLFLAIVAFVPSRKGQ